jgi:unsaturated chondroitin disaccharide hydrolase
MQPNKSVGIEDVAARRRDAWRRAFALCINKSRKNIVRLADKPKAGAWAIDGNYFAFPQGFFEIGNWTSSFFTGMALIAWRETEDEFLLQQVERLAEHYRTKVFVNYMDTHHDLGFLYSLYSVPLYKLTRAAQHRDTGLRAASVLAQRFHRTGKFIRAWGRADSTEFKDMAIIDSMMNLPLLFWAANETSDDRFYDIAVQHASTILDCFIRDDGSVYHAFHFDLKTGKPLCGDSYGGCAVESHWARGAAWAIYGFALAHSHTNDQRFLDAALRVACKFVACLDDSVVPLWDFDPIDGTPLIRDASAASIAVCGLQELSRHIDNEGPLAQATSRILEGLCSDVYLNFDDGCPGIQRCGQVGDGTPGGAQNAYTSWGDYFLMEALARELSDFHGWW